MNGAYAADANFYHQGAAHPNFPRETHDAGIPETGHEGYDVFQYSGIPDRQAELINGSNPAVWNQPNMNVKLPISPLSNDATTFAGNSLFPLDSAVPSDLDSEECSHILKTEYDTLIRGSAETPQMLSNSHGLNDEKLRALNRVNAMNPTIPSGQTIQAVNSSNQSISSSSDHDDKNDVYSKRKAQNRAAQRAFRERKENKLKELMQLLEKSEDEKKKLASEIEVLKKENTVISTENEVLLKTATQKAIQNPSFVTYEKTPEGFYTFPNKFYSVLMEGHSNDDQIKVSHDSYQAPDGQKVMGIGAVWNRIDSDPDVDKINVSFVINTLRGNERCYGYGPAYSQELVEKVIAESKRASASK